MFLKKEKIVKEKMVFGLAVLFLAVLAGAPMLYAAGDNSSPDDDKADDSIISEEGRANATEGASSRFAGVVVDEDQENDSDPSAFEGDSESMPGERAPEELPMSDTPVEEGMGVEI
jgi:hypothetical protein